MITIKQEWLFWKYGIPYLAWNCNRDLFQQRETQLSVCDKQTLTPAVTPVLFTKKHSYREHADTGIVEQGLKSIALRKSRAYLRRKAKRSPDGKVYCLFTGKLLYPLQQLGEQ